MVSRALYGREKNHRQVAKQGGRKITYNVPDSVTSEFLLVSSDQREDLIFSATMTKAKNQSKT